jgi:hypothetical protein
MQMCWMTHGLQSVPSRSLHKHLVIHRISRAVHISQGPSMLSPARRLLRRKAFDSLPARVPNYPGSDSRVAAFCERFPDAEEHGQVADGVVGVQPVRLRTGLTPDTVRRVSRSK